MNKNWLINNKKEKVISNDIYHNLIKMLLSLMCLFILINLINYFINDIFHINITNYNKYILTTFITTILYSLIYCGILIITYIITYLRIKKINTKIVNEKYLIKNNNSELIYFLITILFIILSVNINNDEFFTSLILMSFICIKILIFKNIKTTNDK